MGKIYIGDGVYVMWHEGEIVLTTENGYGITNRIVLEPQVLEAFLAYVQQKETARGTNQNV